MAEKKRRVGRPAKNPPETKKAKTSRQATPAKAPTPKEPTPVPEVVEIVREPTPLPDKVSETKPLPTLSEAQPLDRPDEEYQSINASGVLLASLERSRQKWVSGYFLDKYWTKTSTRKDAPPPPPNNPQRTWMKDIGTCTITIEPLILDATVFYVKEPGMAGPVAQYHPPAQRQGHQPQSKAQNKAQPVSQPPSQLQPLPQTKHQPQLQPQAQSQPPAPSPYGTPYRQQPTVQHGHPSNLYQSRPLPPNMASPTTHTTAGDGRVLPPVVSKNNQPPHAAPRPPPPAQQHQQQQQQQQQPQPKVQQQYMATPAPPPPPPAKPSPDPVIQMLATRASSDHELKSLMKVVATGNANQEQLRIFQRHIDELTAIINRNKAQQPPPPPLPPQQQSQHYQPPSRCSMPGTPTYAGTYGSGAPSRTSTPLSAPQPQLLPRPGPVATPPPVQHQKHANQYTVNQSHSKPQTHVPHPPPQKHYPPAQQPSLPIVLEFQGPGASPDRFRFPEYSILEFLSPHMLLVSFLYIRKSKPASQKPIKKPKEGETPADNIKEEEGVEEETKDTYEPVTLKITVDETQKGRDLLGFIQRSVQPAAETRTWMIEQIGKCKRAERRYLALRLPHKSRVRESTEEASKEETPVTIERVKRAAPRKSMDKKPKDKEGTPQTAKEAGKEDDAEAGKAKGTAVEPTNEATAPPASDAGVGLDKEKEASRTEQSTSVAQAEAGQPDVTMIDAVPEAAAPVPAPEPTSAPPAYGTAQPQTTSEAATDLTAIPSANNTERRSSRRVRISDALPATN
ncbi:hypothetical protein AAFC00_006420 [Neodothiora populina]|uniref:SWR1-complex protein 3 domain-containing protein n=1 Tax=Neodothiora populina TaxID=2781224 RepID=A0ABR3P6I8_9PEZI